MRQRWQAYAKFEMECPVCHKVIPAGNKRPSKIQLAGWRWTCPRCAVSEKERFRVYLLDADNRAAFLEWCERTLLWKLSKLLDSWHDCLRYRDGSTEAEPFVNAVESIEYRRRRLSSGSEVIHQPAKEQRS